MGLIFVLLWHLAAPLTLTVSPRFAVAPHDLRVLAKVAQDQRNSFLIIQVESVDSTAYLQQSARELDGKDAPGFIEFHYNLKAPGHYLVTGVLGRQGLHDVVVTEAVCFAGGEVSC